MSNTEIALQLLEISKQLSQLRLQGLIARYQTRRYAYSQALRLIPNVGPILSAQDEAIKAVRAKPYNHTIATEALDHYESLIERL